MTNWLPELPAGKGPMYARLAHQIAEDIMTGTLPSGAKLPPQRDLAYDLGVTVGTVGRAYAIVRERGLVSGEVGRGTFVLGSAPAQENGQAAFPEQASETASQPRRNVFTPAVAWTEAAMTAPDPGFGSTRAAVPPADAMRLDSTSAPEVGQAEIIGLILSDITRESPHEIASYTRSVSDDWREAGRRWLSRSNWSPDANTIVPANGAQAAIMAILAATTSPGDRVAFEELTYSSIARGAALSGRQPVTVARDEQGPVPEDLERVCSQKHPRVLFVMPTIHNPTLSTMGEARRKDIVTIARQHNLWLVEDEVYGSLRNTDLTPVAALAPERTFHVGSLSKSVTAGVRGGWVSAPTSHAQRIYTAHKMLSGGIAYLLAELSSRLILSGAAATLRARILDEITARHAIACACLDGHDFISAPDTPFLWLKLPEPWMSSTFKAAANSAGVLIDDEDEFKTGRSGKVYHRVRIGFSNPRNREETRQGLTVLRQLLDNPATGYDSFE
ncbi:PLP-dependent aminotransferase family protein [Roseibium litorale]|uniref:PLP-dependent aminotransferase family protein n=1 Tax=Roseibium litorale TaxID=2803841 RepID=A0ABR9CI02_9HYPH|nr:PLP-dependent aminotransferase family protein [Roseibium litorale]MBD8890353.1 PLP-dependent aminotransferase family protein [Roseibium litorale]